MLNKFLHPVSALTSASNWGSLALRALGLAAVQVCLKFMLDHLPLAPWQAGSKAIGALFA